MLAFIYIIGEKLEIFRVPGLCRAAIAKCEFAIILVAINTDKELRCALTS